MFVVRNLSVQVVWTRGSSEVDLGWIDYQLQQDIDFVQFDQCVTELAPNALAGPSAPERANQALAAKLTAGAGSGMPVHAPGAQPAAHPTAPPAAHSRASQPAQQRQRPGQTGS